MAVQTIMARVLWAVALGAMLATSATVGGAERAGDPAEREGDSAASWADRILRATGTRGGLVVHLGSGDGELTAALCAGRSYLVQGLDADAAKVEVARRHVQSIGRYGTVSVDAFDGKRLPYIDNLVNLVVAEDLSDVPVDEVIRVLCPGGVALIPKAGGEVAGIGGPAGGRSAVRAEEVELGARTWTKIVKLRPAGIDEWTHYLHDASNNAVAHDAVVGPPRRMQWVGSPRYSRHHDRMSSVSAVVSAGGRVFTIIDEALPVSILSPPKWTLVARDAFNGVILWKRRIDHWYAHLWPLKSGPAQLPRRLVTDGEQVYVTLGLDAPLEALDAATGKTVRTFDATKAAEEVILCDGVLFVLVNDATEKEDYDGWERFGKGYGAKYWGEAPRKLVAVRADSGQVLWTAERRVLPGTLAADGKRVVFHDGQSAVCLDRNSGQQRWRSEPVARSEEIRGFYVPILVLYDDVVLFSGGETAGKQTGSWYESGEDTMTALDAETGKVLWSAYHPPSGYRSPEDLLVAGGLVWTGETTSGRAVGLFTGRDPRTGEVKREFPPDVHTYWFHHRCYRSKATDKYLLTSRTGIEFLDFDRERWIPHHWVRGACLYGVMPANGLVYAPQHPCACYLEAKLYGFNALAPESAGPRVPEDAAKEARLQKGPAYAERPDSELMGQKPPSDQWPTYRHDAGRSGQASTSVPATLKPAWQTQLGGRLSSPVIADGKVFVASVDAHTVHALDAASGQRLWQHTVGAPVDSPPTIHRGLVLFGSADGCLYALRAADGLLAWRFRAAPMDERLVAFEQVESVWPVHGSVLVQDGVLYCVAGRSMFLDGGLRLLRLDPLTGRLLSETVLDDRDPAGDRDLQAYVSWLNMPTALPDVLSSDGRRVYMRSQPFDLDGKRLPLEPMPRGEDADRGAPPATQRAEHAHLFSPTGFLDDTWWHRTYWMYGSTFVSGWCGYFLAGKAAPAGRILVFDDARVYGFGRKPKYYRWTTPIEHHLFAADKLAPPSDDAQSAKQFAVAHHWTRDVPLLARAMVLADGTLFLAGPVDMVDEEQALRGIKDPEVRRALADQAIALEGKKGGLLWAVSAADGEKLAEHDLDAPPVFDGMAAASGRLYLATQDGAVRCFAE
jgi:outer membrane protein assembly factor BamB